MAAQPDEGEKLQPGFRPIVHRGVRLADDVPNFAPDGDLLCPACERVVRFQRSHPALWAGCECGTFVPFTQIVEDPPEHNCGQVFEVFAPCIPCSMLVRTGYEITRTYDMSWEEMAAENPEVTESVVEYLADAEAVKEPAAYREETWHGHRHLVCSQRPLLSEPHPVAEFCLRAYAGWEMNGQPGTLTTMNIPPQPGQEGAGMAIVCEEGSVKCAYGHGKAAYGDDYRRVERNWKKTFLPNRTFLEVADLNALSIALTPSMIPLEHGKGWEGFRREGRNVASRLSKFFSLPHRPSCLGYATERLCSNLSSLADWTGRMESAREAADLERWVTEWTSGPPFLKIFCFCDPRGKNVSVREGVKL